MINLQISTPNAQLWHLVNMLQWLVKVPPHLISVFNGRSDVLTSDQVPITSLVRHKYIICSEICSKDEDAFISLPVFQYVSHATQHVHCEYCSKAQQELKVNLKRCTRCMAVAYCSRDCQSKHWLAHCKVCTKDLKMSVGIPFYITLNKTELTYQTIEESLRTLAKHSIENINRISAKNEIVDNTTSNPVDLGINCNLVIKTSFKVNVNDETCVNLTQENLTFDMLSKVSCLILEWQTSLPEEGKSKIEICSKIVPTHDVSATNSIPAEESKCTLHDCLKLFMEPEKLDEKESWYVSPILSNFHSYIFC